jgi:hypothetical protein
MLNRCNSWLLLLCCLVFLASCSKKDPEPIFTFKYNFQTTLEGWQVGFADLPTTDIEHYELGYGHLPLPSPLPQDQRALMIHGHNRSDDLFMFAQKELTGLQPNTRYKADFKIVVANDAPTNSVGIGGSPASLYLKAGISAQEPQLLIGDLGYEAYVLNWDKGNQAEGGKDMVVLGTLGHTGEEFEYQLLTRTNAQPFEFRTDGTGRAWVVVGTDSAFEGFSRLYYNQIEIVVSPL